MPDTMTDAPITAPDPLTALCELADHMSAVVQLRYCHRRYICAVLRDGMCYAYAVGLTVSGVVDHALRQLEAAESRFVALGDDDECPSCYGSGGGPDAALRCTSCSGRGYV